MTKVTDLPTAAPQLCHLLLRTCLASPYTNSQPLKPQLLADQFVDLTASSHPKELIHFVTPS